VQLSAYQAAVRIGKEAAVVPGLEAFPKTATLKPEDVKAQPVKAIESLGMPARPALNAALASPSPLARMTAVLALETMGTAADADALAKLARDRGVVRGFPPGTSVGREATRVAAALKAQPPAAATK
jgi:hypothetical protein